MKSKKTKKTLTSKKSLLKNKIGSYVILGVLIIPIVFGLLVVTVGAHLRNRNVSVKYQTSLDTFMYALANQYASKYTTSEFDVCVFYDDDLEEIGIKLHDYVSLLDGYYNDDLWKTEVTIMTNEELGSDGKLYDTSKHKNHNYLVAKLNAVLPNTNNLTDYETYYANNSEEWQTRIDGYNENDKTSQMIRVNIVSISSAF